MSVLTAIDIAAMDALIFELDVLPVVPASQNNLSKNWDLRPVSNRGFEFRPLTEEEKKEFHESLGDEGRALLAELEGRLPASRNGKRTRQQPHSGKTKIQSQTSATQVQPAEYVITPSLNWDNFVWHQSERLPHEIS